MRDEILFPYFANLQTLPSVGEKYVSALKGLVGGDRVVDLLLHLPVRWIDRRRRASMSGSLAGEIATLEGRVESVSPGRGSAPTRIVLSDGEDRLVLAFFHARPKWLQRRFPLGEVRLVSGMVEEFRGKKQMTHPDHVLDPVQDPPLPPAEPHYRLCNGIGLRLFRKWLAAALSSVCELPEWHNFSLIREQGWPGFRESLSILHQPDCFDLERFERARKRLVQDEAFARELAIEATRRMRGTARAAKFPERDHEEIYSALSFVPTAGQRRVIAEIGADMSEARPMRRMLQGDVGSGKTLVAALAIAQAASAGFVSVMMSPSEILARQQAGVLEGFLRPAGYSCAALTGRDKGAVRKRLLERFSGGEIQVLSGTQALFRGGAGFKKLGLVIIDEQHRFGVNDRMKLVQSGRDGLTPHLLVMSATPIPRTLAMTLHGDLEMSVLDEKPPGRNGVTTRAVSGDRLPEIVDAISRAVERGEKAFWVCPALEALEDKAAVSRHKDLSKALTVSVALVHSRMSGLERDGALESFRSGESSVLVATSVVEVGVDVPDASIMVIEGAERFGLAQLHQLRGRVGRGEAASFCLLVYTPPLNEKAERRIRMLRQSDDGFAIAEMDFRLRGPGDLLGLRQSGLPYFRILDLTKDASSLVLGKQEAQELLWSGSMSDDQEKSVNMLRELVVHQFEIPDVGNMPDCAIM